MKVLTLDFRDFLGVEESMATTGKLEGDVVHRWQEMGDVENDFVG
jgi:hypothetical protein